MDLNNQKEYWDSVAGIKTFTHTPDLPMLSSWLTAENLIVDYGCGYGRVVRLLQKAGYSNVRGYDTSKALIQRGAGDGVSNIFAIEDASYLPEGEGSIDCVILFAVLTCIPGNSGQVALIGTLYDKLKPSGIIYISDYYLQDEASEARQYECFDGDAENYGVFTLPEGVTFRHHTRDWIQQLLGKFSIKEEKSVSVTTMNGKAGTAFQIIAQK